MIDPDISSADALRLLSVPASHNDNDPAGMDRRRFLQMMGWGIGGGLALGGLGEVVGTDLLPGRLREAYASTPIGPHDGILVLIGQFGGSDGLNIVVPHGNPTYYQQHGRPENGGIAIPENQVLQINGQIGLNPNLSYLKALYDAGQVAIMQGVGYPNPDLSHFSSMAYWMYGRAGNGNPTTGWVGRWLDGLAGDDPFRATTIGQGLPLHLIGAAKRGIAIPQWGVGFGGDPNDESHKHQQRMYTAVRAFSATPAGRGPWHDSIAQTMKGVIDVGQQVAPIFAAALPENDLEKKLTVIARLINADIGIRVLDTGHDGFDNHSSEPQDLSSLMLDFDQALQAFFNVLAPQFRSRVTLMTYSEFGRTSWSNDSSGTDHGTTNNHFIIGPSVRGGLYGQQPSLAGLDRWDRMESSVDFRSLYATVLDRWLGGGASAVLGANYEQFDVFRDAPGGTVAAPPGPTIGASTGFVPLSPVRILDTRGPLGGHQAAFVANETWNLPVRGIAGVPADAAAVVVNLTGAGASVDTFLTAWPAGEAMPDTSNVNVVANGAVPNLAVVGVGSNGAISLFNSVGSTHVLADLVGYFREGTTDTTALTSLVPSRLLDTRDSTGGHPGAFGPGAEFALQITGRGGVPSSCAAAVLNVTLVGATDDTFLTVWPNGEGMPTTSSVNARANQTAANLVIAKLGADGTLRIRNDRGAAHVLVDVAGYFTDGSGGRYRPVSPRRIVDTRSGVGAPKARVGGTPLGVQITGANGLPTSGVAAVQINLTAVAPSENTYLTVYPSGSGLPNSSNLNLAGGGVRANSVVARVGPDGRIMVACGQGATDVLVDVVGYFTA